MTNYWTPGDVSGSYQLAETGGADNLGDHLYASHVSELRRMTPNWFNAAYYGSGTTDTEINAACAACHAAGGGVVYVPAGTWTIALPVILYDNMTLLGDGEATVIKAADNMAASTITGLGAYNPGLIMNEHWEHDALGEPSNYNINIYSLKVDGNSANNQTREGLGGISLKGCSAARVENCTALDVYGFAGFYFGGADENQGQGSHYHIIGNRAISCYAPTSLTGSGIYITATAEYKAFVNSNYVENCGGRCIFAEDNAADLQIIGNYVLATASRGTMHDTASAGISTGNGDNIIIANNKVRNISGYGIEVGGDRTVVSGNIVSENGYSGIVVSGTTRCSVVGNVSYNNAQESPASGIFLQSASTYNTIANNCCYDNQDVKTQDNGIAEESNTSDHNIYVGNVLVGNQTNSLSLAGANSIYKTAANDPYNVV